MRILYGVTGCGLGHTMRSRALASHLVALGHDVRIAASGRAATILAEEFIVLPIVGMTMSYANGAVRRPTTALRLMRLTPSAIRDNARVALGPVRAFDPDVIVTDFDSFACAAAKLFGKPVVSVDHQHIIDRFEHPRAITRHVSMFRRTCAVVSAKTPRCERYVVTSFFFPKDERRATTLVGPIVRPAIARAVPTDGDHVLVYQTTDGDGRLVPALRANPSTRFIVYGLGRVETIGNVTLRTFDEARFIEELASARAVITNGGYTTLGEAVYLGKPVLSIPVRRQPEQELNAAYLEELGFGATAPSMSASVVARFLKRRDFFERASDPRVRSGTVDACAALERAVHEVAA